MNNFAVLLFFFSSNFFIYNNFSECTFRDVRPTLYNNYLPDTFSVPTQPCFFLFFQPHNFLSFVTKERNRTVLKFLHSVVDFSTRPRSTLESVPRASIFRKHTLQSEFIKKKKKIYNIGRMLFNKKLAIIIKKTNISKIHIFFFQYFRVE